MSVEFFSFIRDDCFNHSKSALTSDGSFALWLLRSVKLLGFLEALGNKRIFFAVANDKAFFEISEVGDVNTQMNGFFIILPGHIGSFIHAAHGDVLGGESWGTPDKIDEIYLNNPVVGNPLDL
uniref:Non-specific protein-tyrosine kinase n=1 Tax=Angiostrongylus cantonensis TaxID=6313 RepID=A0A0K0D5H1_ANGCA